MPDSCMRSVALLAAAVAGPVAGCRTEPPAFTDRGSVPITNGQIDDGDHAVVGLVSDSGIYCTGTLIAPRVVLTAAHCLVSTTVARVVVGVDEPTGLHIDVVHAQLHPAFDSFGLIHDIGLVLLAERAPVPPVTLLEQAVDASFVGETVRLVGFGGTTTGGSGAGRKRHGTGAIDSLTDDVVEILPDPSLTCGGDSGGPAFVAVDSTEYLIGVTSAGDADCATFTRSTRVDAHAGFIADFVASTVDGAAAQGQRCFYDEHCAAGACFFPVDAPRFGYCASHCADDDDCAAGMCCTEQSAGASVCRYPVPSPGALGADCSTYDQCDSLLCARDEAGGRGSCSSPCTLDGPDSCPAGYRCAEDADQAQLAACFAIGEVGEGTCTGAGAGGCDAGGSDSGVPIPAALALLLASARRRRRGATTAPR